MEQQKTFFYFGSVWEKIKTKDVLFFLTLLLFFVIPFQQRLYKFLRPLSRSLVDASWNLPACFEIHLDGFISDFVILGIIFFCFKQGMVRWRSFFWEGERKYLSLFLVFALISIINSRFTFYPLLYWRWLHLVLPAFLFFFLSRVPLEKSHFTKIAQIVLASALVECAIALPQYFVQHSLGLQGLGEVTLIGKHYVACNFPMADGSVWIFDKFFHGVREHPFVLRASGTLLHPNMLGGFLVFTLIMTYHLYGQAQKRFWLSLAILLQMFCLFTTYSRSAIFAGAFVTVLWCAITYWREKKFSSLFWVTAVSAALSLGLLYPQWFHRGGMVSHSAVASSSDAIRLTVQDTGVTMFKANPWLGMGFNTYKIAFETFALGFQVTNIHNIYLHLAVEVGIFGVLAFLAFCFFVVKRGLQNIQRPEIATCFSIFISILLIGFADYYPIVRQEHCLIFFMTAGLMISCRPIKD